MGLRNWLAGFLHKGCGVVRIYLLRIGAPGITADEAVRVLKHVLDSPDCKCDPRASALKSQIDSTERLPCALAFGSTTGVVVSSSFVLKNSQIKMKILSLVKETWDVPKGRLRYYPAELDGGFYAVCLLTDEPEERAEAERQDSEDSANPTASLPSGTQYAMVYLSALQVGRHDLLQEMQESEAICDSCKRRTRGNIGFVEEGGQRRVVVFCSSCKASWMADS